MSELVPADFEAMAAWPASRTAMVLPGGFDRVASTCLLSQILETAAHSLGKGHRQLADAEAALRAGHLRLMARLAAPGGEAVLVTDVVSSQMLAALPALPAEALAGLLTRLGRKGNHFRGVHPRQILATLRRPVPRAARRGRGPAHAMAMAASRSDIPRRGDPLPTGAHVIRPVLGFEKGSLWVSEVPSTTADEAASILQPSTCGHRTVEVSWVDRSRRGHRSNRIDATGRCHVWRAVYSARRSSIQRGRPNDRDAWRTARCLLDAGSRLDLNGFCLGPASASSDRPSRRRASERAGEGRDPRVAHPARHLA